jgi:hypothetical protein
MGTYRSSRIFVTPPHVLLERNVLLGPEEPLDLERFLQVDICKEEEGL